MAKVSAPSYLKISSEVVHNSTNARSSLKKSKSNDISQPAERLTGNLVPSRISLNGEEAAISNSVSAAHSGEAHISGCNSPIQGEIRSSIPTEIVATESRARAQRVVVMSPGNQALPDLFHAAKDNPTNESFVRFASDRESDASVMSRKSPSTSADPVRQSNLFVEGVVRQNDPSDVIGSLDPKELDSNRKKTDFENRNASEGSSGLKFEDSCKHTKVSDEIPRIRAPKLPPKPKRSRSYEQFMGLDEKRLLRRRSFREITAALEASACSETTPRGEGCRTTDEANIKVLSSSEIYSETNEFKSSLISNARQGPEDSAAYPGRISHFKGIPEPGRMKESERAETVALDFTEFSGSEVERRIEASMEQNRRLGKVFEDARNAKAGEFEENQLSSDFFELKGRYLSSCSTPSQSNLREDEAQTSDDYGTETRVDKKRGLPEGYDEEDDFHDITTGVSLASFVDSQKKLQMAAQTDDGLQKSFAFMHSRASSIDAEIAGSSSGFLSNVNPAAARKLRMSEECESDSETFEFQQAVSVFSRENMQPVGDAATMLSHHYHQQQSEMHQQQHEQEPRTSFSQNSSQQHQNLQLHHHLQQQQQQDLRFHQHEQAQMQQQHRHTRSMPDSEEMGRFQEMSVVSTGDAILFSGCNSEEFHLIPSKSFVRDSNNSVNSSPKYVHAPSPRQNLSSPAMMATTNHQQQQQSVLSIDDIILLLEKDELDEEDLLSFLINAKSSCPASDVASESSFEFKIKSSGSTPHSTPSTPMLSAGSTPRRISQLKPIALTPEEIAEIWGVFEQRQALAS